MNYLIGFENNLRVKKLPRVKSKKIKELIIDFLYKLKDKFPLSSSDNKISLSSNNQNDCNMDNKASMDVFDKVMEFMTQNKFKPSKKMIKEYSESKLNKALGLPPFELVNKYTGITKEVYEDLKKRYDAKPQFIYYFNPDYEIKTEKKISLWGFNFMAIGLFVKEANSGLVCKKFLKFVRTFWMICADNQTIGKNQIILFWSPKSFPNVDDRWWLLQ